MKKLPQPTRQAIESQDPSSLVAELNSTTRNLLKLAEVAEALSKLPQPQLEAALEKNSEKIQSLLLEFGFSQEDLQFPLTLN